MALQIRTEVIRPEQLHPGRAGSSNPEAQDAYLRARDVLRRGDNIRGSFDLFQLAILKDPHFAVAYAELPFGLMLAGGFLPADQGLAQWRAAASRALELDPNLSQAHLSYASLLGYHDWNWLEADREYKTALRLNPSLARAHRSYGMGKSAYILFCGRERCEDRQRDELAL